MVGLDLYRALNELGNHVFERRAEECRAVESAQFSCVVFEDMQDFGVADETGFDDFAEPLDEDVIGQRSQRLGVGQHTGRRVERADEVLACGVLMPVLPPVEASTMASSEVGQFT